MTAEPQPAQFHPLIDDISSSIAIAEKPVDSEIPKRELEKIKRRLFAERENKALFLHVLVFWDRVREMFPKVGVQLRALAEMGLGKSVVEKAEKEMDAARGSAKQLDQGENKSLDGSMSRPGAKGVGLRK